jgi:hypothetical protein
MAPHERCRLPPFPGVRIRPNHQNRLDFLLVQRKHIAVVLQQYHAFTRGLQRQLMVLFV